MVYSLHVHGRSRFYTFYDIQMPYVASCTEIRHWKVVHPSNGLRVLRANRRTFFSEIRLKLYASYKIKEPHRKHSRSAKTLKPASSHYILAFSAVASLYRIQLQAVPKTNSNASNGPITASSSAFLLNSHLAHCRPFSSSFDLSFLPQPNPRATPPTCHPSLPSQAKTNFCTLTPMNRPKSPERRGRKLRGADKERIDAAVRELMRQHRAGKRTSVRETAMIFEVSKSTLHRHFQAALNTSSFSSLSLSSSSKPNKASIDFLVSKPN